MEEKKGAVEKLNQFLASRKKKDQELAGSHTRMDSKTIVRKFYLIQSEVLVKL